MSKLLTDELLENGQGKFMTKLALTYDDVKILLKLVEVDLMIQRKDGKRTDYMQTKLLKRNLTDASYNLKKAFQRRQEGRFRKRPDSTLPQH